MKRRLLSALLILSLLLSLFPAALAEELTETESARSAAPSLTAQASQVYRDVNDGDWFLSSVDYVLARGLMNGVSGDAFGPEESMTRAMVVTTLHRMEGSPVGVSAGFSDVPAGTWFSSAVDWAAASGIVYGVDAQNFAPDDPVTREQLAAILYRYAGLKHYSRGSIDILDGFTDRIQINDYARIPLGWTCAEGLITGTSGNTMEPKSSTTRAQMATILMRMDQKQWQVELSQPDWIVIFELNYPGAKFSGHVDIPEGTMVMSGEDPVRDGYVFEGWYTQSSGGERCDFPRFVEDHTVFYAHWSQSATYHTVCFIVGEETVSVETVLSGDSVAAPFDPSQPGYSFIGWYDAPFGGPRYDFPCAVTQDLTLYAQWTVDLMPTGPAPTPEPEARSTPGVSSGTNFTGKYYATPSGEKYHFLITCGGKNSREITEAEVHARRLTACEKCAY